MEYKDYYKVLGVERSASAEDIKRAFRKLAREFHPDRNKAKGAEERFKEINEANEVLSDPKKRKAYDQLGADWRAGERFTPPPGWQFDFGRAGGFAGAGARGRPGMGPGGPDMGGGFSDFFSSLFGAAGGGFGGAAFDDSEGYESAAPRGQRVKIAISLDDSYNGTTRKVTVGQRTLNVRIPKGITEGQVIRLAGQGTRGGDLLMEVEFLTHPRFTVTAKDIALTLAVAPWEAALGQKVPVTTLGGTVELTLPAGSQSGKKLRLKGRGLPGSPPGDQIVTLQIVTPPARNDVDRKFYEDMAKRFDFDPREDAEL
jgi:curved DNA-binding protein